MPQPFPVPRNNESENVGTALKRWLTIFSKYIGNGTDLHLISDLRDALKIKGKIVDDSNIGDGRYLYYNSSTNKVEYSSPDIFDRQFSFVASNTATTSLTLIDLPGMTLTTAVGKTRTYMIDFNCVHNNSNADKIQSFALLIDGSIVRQFDVQSNKNPLNNPIAMQWMATIAPSKIVKVQYCTNANTITVGSRSLRLNGVSL